MTMKKRTDKNKFMRQNASPHSGITEYRSWKDSNQ